MLENNYATRHADCLQFHMPRLGPLEKNGFSFDNQGSDVDG